MRRCDGLVDRHIEEYGARGLVAGSVTNRRREAGSVGRMAEAPAAAAEAGGRGSGPDGSIHSGPNGVPVQGNGARRDGGDAGDG